jgi:hypothetical protein
VRNEPGKQRVYFALSGREVKIGLAKNPPQRIAEMRVARPDIRLLGDIPGDREAERKFQNYFPKERIGGEWFRLTRKVEGALNNLLVSNKEAHAPTVPRKLVQRKPVVHNIANNQRNLRRQWAQPKELSYEFDIPVRQLLGLCLNQEVAAIYGCNPGKTRGEWLINVTSFYDYVRSFLPGGSRHFATSLHTDARAIPSREKEGQ